MSHVLVDLDRTATKLGLDRRLRVIPPDAMVRGVFFNLVHADLERRGFAQNPLWTNRARERRSYELYPATELIMLSSTAGALVNEDPTEGMRQVHASTANYFASTWYGRAFQRFLHPDPHEAFGWIERSRHHIASYGRWRYERRAAQRGILHMFDEYCYIESIQRGGCEGMLTACGVKGEVEVELDSEFQGRLLIRWDEGAAEKQLTAKTPRTPRVGSIPRRSWRLGG